MRLLFYESPMSTTDKAFTGSIPALYDRYLGPLLFEPYATDIAARLSNLTEGRLLEIAAGTGVVTRARRLTVCVRWRKPPMAQTNIGSWDAACVMTSALSKRA
jgi:hypothetical protein